MVDEFEVFRARAYGLRDQSNDDDDADTDVTSDRQHRHHRRHKGGANGSAGGAGYGEPPTGDGEPDDGDYDSPSRHGSQRQRRTSTGQSTTAAAAAAASNGRSAAIHSSRHRRPPLDTQITFAVEPPSPTELSPTDSSSHHRSRSWKNDGESWSHSAGAAGHRQHGGGGGDADPQHGLHRTRTMPAKRHRSSSTVAALQRDVVAPASKENGGPFNGGASTVARVGRASNQDRFLDPGSGDAGNNADAAADDDDQEPQSTDQLECKIYRVRSFTTKKGGSIVNRGDSIKVCSRRGSRQDVLLLAAPSSSGLSRRNSTAGRITGSNCNINNNNNTLLVTTSGNVRRNSVTCIATTGQLGGGDFDLRQRTSRRHSTVVDPDIVDVLNQVGRRASIRSNASTAGRQCDVELVAAALQRRTSGQSNCNVDLVNNDDACCGGVVLPVFRLENGDELQNEESDEQVENGGKGGCGGDVRVLKVMVLGSHGVGKTTLVQQLLTSEYLANAENEQDDDNTDHTVSVQLDDVESMVQFVDTQNTDESTVSQAVNDEDVDAFLVVYSVTDRGSFNHVQSCLQELKRRRTRLQSNVAVVLVANKQDLVRNRVISENEGKRLGSKRHCRFLEVSALLDHKVDEVLVSIIREARQHPQRKHRPFAAGSDDDDVRRNKGCFHRAATFAFCRKLFK